MSTFYTSVRLVCNLSTQESTLNRAPWEVKPDWQPWFLTLLHVHIHALQGWAVFNVEKWVFPCLPQPDRGLLAHTLHVSHAAPSNQANTQSCTHTHTHTHLSVTFHCVICTLWACLGGGAWGGWRDTYLQCLTRAKQKLPCYICPPTLYLSNSLGTCNVTEWSMFPFRKAIQKCNIVKGITIPCRAGTSVHGRQRQLLQRDLDLWSAPSGFTGPYIISVYTLHWF